MQQTDRRLKAQLYALGSALVFPLVYALIMAAPHAHAARPYGAHITGQALVREMLADPREGQLNAVQRERAMGYIDGIMGATAGQQWCPGNKTVPHEMNYLIVEELSAMGSDKLKAHAAPLVLAVLARHYPCKTPAPQR